MNEMTDIKDVQRAHKTIPIPVCDTDKVHRLHDGLEAVPVQSHHICYRLHSHKGIEALNSWFGSVESLRKQIAEI